MNRHLHGDDIYRYGNIRINFSSNIYSHADLSRLKEHLSAWMDCIGSYPEPEPEALEAMIAEREGIDRKCVVVGNGATELIYLIADMMRGGTFMVHNPTFSEYEKACRMNGMREVADSSEADVEWICNPNNPDGRVMDKTLLLKKIAEHPRTLFVIDASYEDYTLCPLPETKELLGHKNVICLHSMTKRYCIPGLRLGYAIGQRDAIERIKALHQPWSVNALAQVAGRFLLENDIWVLPPMEEYIKEAQRLAKAINSLEGFSAEISDTHFFLCKTVGNAGELKDMLARKHGILIRDASNFPTLTEHHFRIASQSIDANRALLDVLGD